MENTCSPFAVMSEADTPKEIISAQLKKWINENRRKPLFYVCHPDDWAYLIRLYEPIREISSGVIRGIPILVNSNVPIGKSGFVG